MSAPRFQRDFPAPLHVDVDPDELLATARRVERQAAAAARRADERREILLGHQLMATRGQRRGAHEVQELWLRRKASAC